jgi:hypothetical protein
MRAQDKDGTAPGNSNRAGAAALALLRRRHDLWNRDHGERLGHGRDGVDAHLYRSSRARMLSKIEPVVSSRFGLPRSHLQSVRSHMLSARCQST